MYISRILEYAIFGLAAGADSDRTRLRSITTKSMYSIYSALLSASINLRAALLERLDHQPGHPPKKGIRDCHVNRVLKRE